MNDDMDAVKEAAEITKWEAKADMIDSFDETLFIRFVDSIIVYSREEIGFKLKCGLTLKERLVG